MATDHAATTNGRGPNRYDYGGNPLAREQTNDSSARFQAFGGNLEPGLFRQQTGRKLGNPAPLGLSAFALTTFLLSLINLGTRGTSTPNIVVATAWAYGGLVQLLAGMWEFACEFPSPFHSRMFPALRAKPSPRHPQKQSERARD